jgi:hypothetical protein
MKSVNGSRKSISPFVIRSPKMRKSSNKSDEKVYVRGSTISFKRKSPKKMSPKSTASSKKKTAVGAASLNKLEDKVKTLYGPNNIFDAPKENDDIVKPLSKPKSVAPKPCNSKCNILSNKCYIDCINYITTNISEYKKNPSGLVDDLFIMIEPRMNKDIYVKNVNTANLYNNMVDYTAQTWNDEDIKTVKSLVRVAKGNSHYKPVKMFIKEVKFYKYYT